LLGARGKGGSSTTSASANQSLCASLSGLETSTKALTSLDPQTASKSDYESAVSSVQSDWSQVTTDAKTVASDTMATLDDAWNSFDAALKSVPGSASVATLLQDVSTQGHALATTTETTISALSCS